MCARGVRQIGAVCRVQRAGDCAHGFAQGVSSLTDTETTFWVTRSKHVVVQLPDNRVTDRQGLLDFCNQAGFVRAAFLNLDCRIERGSLFEGAAGLLSKTAFPVNRPLAPVHLLALDGLLAIMSALARGCAARQTLVFGALR